VTELLSSVGRQNRDPVVQDEVNEKCECRVDWLLHNLKAIIKIQKLKNRIRMNILPK